MGTRRWGRQPLPGETKNPQVREGLLCLRILFGGAEGTRTPDPLHAMQMRYQLRHSPIVLAPRCGVTTRGILATRERRCEIRGALRRGQVPPAVPSTGVPSSGTARL